MAMHFGRDLVVPAESYNSGDPIVLYDQLADRWFLSQFAIGAVNYQCIAVSQTGDPTGAYFLYAFDWGSKMNDYPKFGVWMDAYYMTVNQFLGNSWAGAGYAAFERDKMLGRCPCLYAARRPLWRLMTGLAVCSPPTSRERLPPAGTPAYFAEVDDSSFWPGPGG